MMGLMVAHHVVAVRPLWVGHGVVGAVGVSGWARQGSPEPGRLWPELAHLADACTMGRPSRLRPARLASVRESPLAERYLAGQRIGLALRRGVTGSERHALAGMAIYDPAPSYALPSSTDPREPTP